MVNRERFMLDVDSEGFPHRYADVPHPALTQNLGKTADHAVVQALLADHKCIPCTPRELTVEEQAFVAAHEDLHQSLSKVPAITWGVPYDDIGGFPTEEERKIARRLLQEMQDCANINHDGITRLSDSYAPDAFYGWKR